MRLIVVMLSLSAGSIDAIAQSATVTVSHNDPDGFVEPGQSVRVRVVVTYAQAISFWEIRGSAIAEPNVGTASNNVFPHEYPAAQQLIVNAGALNAGSVVDVRVRSGDNGFFFGGTTMPPWSNPPLTILQFDWTAPSVPGDVAFDWRPYGALPQVWLIAPLVSMTSPVPAATTYLGTSLTVIPAPTAPLTLTAGLGTLGLIRRRR